MTNSVFYFIGVYSFIIMISGINFLFIWYLKDRYEEISFEISWKGMKVTLKKRTNIRT
jgi:hypothetical protein